MVLDVRSHDRAIHALDFFDKRINRYAANPTHMRLVNRFFSVEEMPNREIHPSLDPFFDRDDIPCLAREMEQALNQIEAEYADNPEGREKAVSDYITQQMDRPHPEIEELLIYPDKIERISLPMALQMRRAEAFEHWRGNFTFRSTDIVKRWVEAMADELEDEILFEVEEDGQADEESAQPGESDKSVD